jgi:hypothetical protein
MGNLAAAQEGHDRFLESWKDCEEELRTTHAQARQRRDEL